MMTTASLKEVLLDSAKEVFKTMVSMAVTELDEDAPFIEEMVRPVTLLGSITFKGGLEGCLGVCCDVACARTIAANMLGIDVTEGLTEADICDAIGELANMVLGATKARIQNEVGGIDVSIPLVVRGRELQNSPGAGANMVALSVDIEKKYTAEFSLMYRTGRKSVSNRFTELLRFDTRGAGEEGREGHAGAYEQAQTCRADKTVDGTSPGRPGRSPNRLRPNGSEGSEPRC
jgi:chemotaxis protein CheX